MLDWSLLRFSTYGSGKVRKADSAKPRFPGHEQPLRLKDGHHAIGQFFLNFPIVRTEFLL